MPVETKCAWCGAILLDADHAAAHVVNKCEKSPSKKMADVLERALNVGEIRFKTCVLSAQVHDEIVAVLRDVGRLP